MKMKDFENTKLKNYSFLSSGEVRVSEGTGSVLGLWKQGVSVPPKTAYFMTYHESGCEANCAFCPQAQDSNSDLEKLSRVSWPIQKFTDVKGALSKNKSELKRTCVQALNYPGVVDDICDIIDGVKRATNLPVSVSCQPLNIENMKSLTEAGADRLCIPVDAATPQIFDSVKGESIGGPYEWDKHIRALEKAIEIFDGGVTTHLIVGLGETERELIQRIQFFYDMGITVGLFAFTPVKGSRMENVKPPAIEKYRVIQLAHYLIFNEMARAGEMEFCRDRLDSWGVDSGIIRSVVESGEPFRTSGCPNCNRPFYNESPRGPLYNFPEELSKEDLGRVHDQIRMDI